MMCHVWLKNIFIAERINVRFTQPRSNSGYTRSEVWANLKFIFGLLLSYSIWEDLVTELLNGIKIFLNSNSQFCKLSISQNLWTHNMTTDLEKGKKSSNDYQIII